LLLKFMSTIQFERVKIFPPRRTVAPIKYAIYGCLSLLQVYLCCGQLAISFGELDPNISIKL